MSPVEDRSEELEKDGRFGESRRKFLQRSAGIGVGLAALYAPPQVRSTGVPKAYATGTQVDVAPPDAGSQQIYWSSQVGASVGWRSHLRHPRWFRPK